MQKPIRTAQPYRTQKQKAISTLANANSVVGHTAGVFGGVAVGVNVAKVLDDNGANRGVSVALGFISAIAVVATVSLITEKVSNTMRKKAGVDSPLSMLCGQNDFYTEDYNSLFENSEMRDYDSLYGCNLDKDNNHTPEDAQEGEYDCDS